MNPRGILFVVIALLGVMAVVLLTRSFLSSAVADAQNQAPRPVAAKNTGVPVLVAKRDLKVGTLLKPEDYEFSAWPKDGVGAHHIKDKKTAETLPGQVVRIPFVAGEPVIASKLVAPGRRGFLAAALSPGMRASTIKVSAVGGVGGFIFAGDRVDVILTHNADGHRVAETVLQNVRVLGLDQRSTKDDQAAKLAKTVTLEVTPRMAEKVAILPQLGALTLVLRALSAGENNDGQDYDAPPIDVAGTHTYGAEVSNLIENPGEQRNLGRVRVARGGAVNVVEFKKTAASASGDSAASSEGEDE